MKTLNDLILYLKDTWRAAANSAAAEESNKKCRAAAREVYRWLKAYPEIYERVRSSYGERGFAPDEDAEHYGSDLFYIPDMLVLLRNLEEKQYFAFTEYLIDFLENKICRGNSENAAYTFPKNIRDALLLTIEKGCPELC